MIDEVARRAVRNLQVRVLALEKALAAHYADYVGPDDQNLNHDDDDVSRYVRRPD